MNIIIKTKNLQLSDSLKSFIDAKMGGISKFHKNLIEIFVDIVRENDHHRKGEIFKTEIIVFLPNKKLVAQATGEDLYKTITGARDEIKQEIQKQKLKTIELPRRKSRKMKKTMSNG